MAEFVRREHVKAVYFTDRPTYSPWYGTVRSAGARKIIVHNHFSAALKASRGIRRAAKRAVLSVPGVAKSLVDPVRSRHVWSGIDPIPEGSE